MAAATAHEQGLAGRAGRALRQVGNQAIRGLRSIELGQYVEIGDGHRTFVRGHFANHDGHAGRGHGSGQGDPEGLAKAPNAAVCVFCQVDVDVLGRIPAENQTKTARSHARSKSLFMAGVTRQEAQPGDGEAATRSGGEDLPAATALGGPHRRGVAIVHHRGWTKLGGIASGAG
jgi:hypothetical protein